MCAWLVAYKLRKRTDLVLAPQKGRQREDSPDRMDPAEATTWGGAKNSKLWNVGRAFAAP